MDRTVEFYKKVLGLHVIMDFGANKTLTGGLCLQTLETYKDFIGTSAVSFGGNNIEVYLWKIPGLFKAYLRQHKDVII